MPIFNKRYKPKYYKKFSIAEKQKTVKRAKTGIVFSNLLLISGFLILLTFVAYPLYSSVFYSPRASKIIKPFSGTVMGFSYNSVSSEFYFTELSNDQKKTDRKDTKPPYEEFYITIPKLGVNQARVLVDSVDLNPKGFIGHYKGTSLPGEIGNSFLYGHSTLPILYDPSDYKAVFTKIPNLEVGDEFTIQANGQDYTYVVKMGKELLPEEINPYGAYYPSLYNKSTVTLMTCTPPGTKKNRYIVLSELK